MLPEDALGAVVQAVFLLAAGMYPLGFMLGSSCSRCCGCRNDTCEGFDLEEAFGPQRTSGRMGYCQEFTAGPGLLSLQFSATCYGSGAAGTVQGLGGKNGPGPLVGVTLTSQGSDYARLGRRAPTLSIDNESTTPAEVTFTLSQDQGECDLDYWSLESISITDGGTGYTHESAVTITASAGDTVVAAASGVLLTSRLEPDIKVSTESGKGATFSVSVLSDGGTPPTWSITGVTFSGSTSGFVDGQNVTFSGDNLVEVYAATATVVAKRAEPVLSATVPGYTGGSGAAVSLSLAQNLAYPGSPGWKVSSVSVDSPGTGYSRGIFVDVSVLSGYGPLPASLRVSNVGGSGEVLEVAVDNGGLYYDLSDELESISVGAGGAYYKNTGAIESISITDGGIYYREDSSLTPYVKTPAVTVQQSLPSAGSGAKVTATVDSNTSSATFGRVTSLSLADAGDDYLAFDLIGNWEYVGGGVFDFVFAGAIAAIQDFPQRGCRVYGPGIAEGTVVTEVDEIQIPPKQPYVLGDKRGCCDIRGVVNNNGLPYLDRDNRTEQGCLDQRDIVSQIVTITSYSWTECVGCNGTTVGPVVISGGIVGEIVGARVTVSPAPQEPIGPCISFCGTGGLCGPYPRHPDPDPDSGDVFGPFGSLNLANDPRGLDYRRNCVRWVCRCYEGTGKQGQPLYPNAEDWYTVASTTVVGGPTVNNLDLGDALTSNSSYQSELNVEQEVLFSYEDWPAAEREIKCLVWAFIFYGLSDGPVPVDLCNLGPTVKTRRRITSGDNVYEIVYCNRCS